MTELIPSKHVRGFAESTGWAPDDLAKAAIVNDRFEFMADERRAALEELKGELTDPEVIAQIDAELATEDRQRELFELPGDDVLFAVTYFDEEYSEQETCGHYRDFGDAFRRGLELGHDFQIEKHWLLAKGKKAPRRISGWLNPYLMPDATFDELVNWSDPDDGEPVGEMSFAADGKVKHVWSGEKAVETVEDLKREYDPGSYRNAFVALPNPFELGDIVRVLDGRAQGTLGVVETSQEGWKRFLGRVEAGGYWDFSDASIVVELVTGGSISHDHIAPIYLEPYEPPEDSPEHDILQVASWMVKGEAGLDYFVDTYEKYKAASENQEGDDGR